MAGKRVGTGVVLAAVAIMALAGQVAAQTVGYLRFGNATYDDDPFCESPTAFVTIFGVGISTPLFGFSAEFNNGDYPWPPPNGNAGVFLTHGKSAQFMAEFNPVQLFASSVSRYARPFIGAGLHISTDGDPRADTGGGEAWGVSGQTRPFIAFGANGLLPLGSRFGLTAGYRYSTVFFGDFDLLTPGGPVQTVAGESLSSSSIVFGLTMLLGGN